MMLSKKLFGHRIFTKHILSSLC